MNDIEFLRRELLAFQERLIAAGDTQSLHDIFDGSPPLNEMSHSELQWIYDEYIAEE